MYIYTYICIYIYVCIYIYIHTYICIYICVYIYICVCICVVYTHTQPHTHTHIYILHYKHIWWISSSDMLNLLDCLYSWCFGFSYRSNHYTVIRIIIGLAFIRPMNSPPFPISSEMSQHPYQLEEVMKIHCPSFIVFRTGCVYYWFSLTLKLLKYRS